MTEDEAKTKWCPFASARVVCWDKSNTQKLNAIWSDDGEQHTVVCIASACMAWRRTNARPTMGEEASGQRAGFCGLAGAPQ